MMTIRTAGAATAVATAAAKPAYDHLIASFIGDKKGPTLIVIGSLHGNEPAGAIALNRVAVDLEDIADKIDGRVYLLAGNTRALSEGVRFVDVDLNRHWTDEHVANSGSGLIFPVIEDLEMRELDAILDHILVTAEDEVYVLDLHSTSADGMPFATVGDTLRNRQFAQRFPVTILLGIEEQLDGTLLEYLNNAGAVTLGFEGGQHRSSRTADRHEAMAWLALVNAGLLRASEIAGFDGFCELLSEGRSGPTVFEVLHRHAVSDTDAFRMGAGFNNFDPVIKGQHLADDAKGPVLAERAGTLLMPLYQKLGEDGYFIGRRVSTFWLSVSSVLRRLGIQDLIHLMPGVMRDAQLPEILTIDTRVARFFPLQIFHLLGFRKLRWSRNSLTVSRRRHDTVSPFVRVGGK